MSSNNPYRTQSSVPVTAGRYTQLSIREVLAVALITLALVVLCFPAINANRSSQADSQWISQLVQHLEHPLLQHGAAAIIIGAIGVLIGGIVWVFLSIRIQNTN